MFSFKNIKWTGNGYFHAVIQSDWNGSNMLKMELKENANGISFIGLFKRTTVSVLPCCNDNMYRLLNLYCEIFGTRPYCGDALASVQ